MTQPLALVTGGASGMGLATVERLATDGFHVFLVDRDANLCGGVKYEVQL